MSKNSIGTISSLAVADLEGLEPLWQPYQFRSPHHRRRGPSRGPREPEGDGWRSPRCGAGGQGGCSPSRACPAGLELGGLILIRGPSLAGAAANDSSGRKCHTAEIRVRAAGAQEDIPTHRFAAEGRHPIGLQHHQEEGTLISACLWQFLRPPLPVRSEAPYSACLVSPAGLLKLAWQVLCCMHACELLLGVYCIF